MRKNVLGSVVAVVLCVAAPFAQQQPAPTSEATPAHKVFVLTGCLEAGAKAAETFKLTDAWFIGRPTPGGTAGAVGTSGQKLSYELRPVSGVDAQGLNADALKAHLGHRVEAIVRPIESPAATAPTAGLAPAQSARPTEPAPERFTVNEIKRVTGRCS
jgi:hypothetical protein